MSGAPNGARRTFWAVLGTLGTVCLVALVTLGFDTKARMDRFEATWSEYRLSIDKQFTTLNKSVDLLREDVQRLESK